MRLKSNIQPICPLPHTHTSLPKSHKLPQRHPFLQSLCPVKRPAQLLKVWRGLMWNARELKPRGCRQAALVLISWNWFVFPDHPKYSVFIRPNMGNSSCKVQMKKYLLEDWIFFWSILKAKSVSKSHLCKGASLVSGLLGLIHEEGEWDRFALGWFALGNFSESQKHCSVLICVCVGFNWHCAIQVQRWLLLTKYSQSSFCSCLFFTGFW